MSSYPEVSPLLLHKYNPLRHQFPPILLSFQTRHCLLDRGGLRVGTYARKRKLSGDRGELNGKPRKNRILTCAVRGLANPPTLLRRHIRCRKDPLCQIN